MYRSAYSKTFTTGSCTPVGCFLLEVGSSLPPEPSFYSLSRVAIRSMVDRMIALITRFTGAIGKQMNNTITIGASNVLGPYSTAMVIV